MDEPETSHTKKKPKSRARTFRSWLRRYGDDVLFLAGFVLFLVGAWHINPLSVWFVSGVECLVAGFLFAWSKRK